MHCARIAHPRRVRKRQVRTLCKTKIMNGRQVIFGYREHGENPIDRHAWLSATAESLVIRVEKDDPIVLTPDEVVEIYIEGGRIMSAALIVEHIAFNKVGNVILIPENGTCKTLLQEIEMSGFRPKAPPAIPWEPGQPFPFQEIEEDSPK